MKEVNTSVADLAIYYFRTCQFYVDLHLDPYCMKKFKSSDLYYGYVPVLMLASYFVVFGLVFVMSS